MKTISCILFFMAFCGNALGQSVADLNEEAYAAYRTADSCLKKMYASVLKDAAYDVALQKAIRETQAAFLTFRKKEAAVYGLKFNGGSMLPCFQYRALREMTEDRVTELEFYFENY